MMLELQYTLIKNDRFPARATEAGDLSFFISPKRR